MSHSPALPPWREHTIFAFIDEPPFARPLRDGGAEGCDVELACTVLSMLGVRRIELRLTTFAELLPGVAAGRWHVNTPLFVTAERARQVAFSRPVWALDDGFIVRAGNPMGLDSYRAIARCGARLGVVKGQVQHGSALAAGVAPQRIHTYATQHEVVQAMLAGEIDAYASTAVGNRMFAAALGDARITAVGPQSPSRAAPVGAFSFALEARELRASFDDVLTRHLGSSAHRAAAAHWGLGSAEIDPVAP